MKCGTVAKNAKSGIDAGRYEQIPYRYVKK